MKDEDRLRTKTPHFNIPQKNIVTGVSASSTTRSTQTLNQSVWAIVNVCVCVCGSLILSDLTDCAWLYFHGLPVF